MKATVSSSLHEQFEALHQQHAGNTPPEEVAKRRLERANLLRSTTGGKSLQVGDLAPDFTLPDAYGKPVTLSTLLKSGPVVLTFYRGDWCPYCNLTLRAYQAILPEITELHGTLVAISPQTPGNSLLTIQHKELTYPVLSDAGNRVARQYTLIWTIPQTERAKSPNLPELNGDDAWELPAPGTFVIAQNGVVKVAFVDADYTRRLEPSAILEGLRRQD